MKTIFINSKKAVRLGKRFSINFDREKIKQLENGTVLAVKKNIKTGEIIEYVLNEIYIKKFNMKYSCHHKTKNGGELMISNFELPRGNIFKSK